MQKNLKLIFSFVVIIFAVFFTYTITNNNKIQNTNNTSTKSYSDIQDINKKGSNLKNITIKDESSDLANKNLDNLEENNHKNDDYSILVTSPLYNAIFYLDTSNREANIKLIDSKDIGQTSSDKYINLTIDDINFLKNNASDLINEFIKCTIFDKYDMMSRLLNQYDTNLQESDIINLAFAYLK